MPCPYFEPTEPISNLTHQTGRLPLVEQYRGFCQKVADGGMLSGLPCNHGYANQICDRYPETDGARCHRFSIETRTPEELTVVFIQEQDYAPVRHCRLRFSVSTSELIEANDLEAPVRAQAAAFCRSFLKLARTRCGRPSQAV